MYTHTIHTPSEGEYMNTHTIHTQRGGIHEYTYHTHPVRRNTCTHTSEVELRGQVIPGVIELVGHSTQSHQVTAQSIT